MALRNVPLVDKTTTKAAIVLHLGPHKVFMGENEKRRSLLQVRLGDRSQIEAAGSVAIDSRSNVHILTLSMLRLLSS